MDFAQLGAFLHKAAALLNERPLSARVFSESEFMALTPKDLLLGRAPSLSVQETLRLGDQEIGEKALAQRVTAVELKLELWWKTFYGDVFPLLIPRASMKVTHPNLQVADIVLVKYCVKFGKDRFRLARVLELREDAHGVVRTVIIGLRNRRQAVREPPGSCKAGLTEMEAPVQRLILILLPGSSQWRSPDLWRRQPGLEGLKCLLEASSPLGCRYQQRKQRKSRTSESRALGRA